MDATGDDQWGSSRRAAAMVTTKIANAGRGSSEPIQLGETANINCGELLRPARVLGKRSSDDDRREPLAARHRKRLAGEHNEDHECVDRAAHVRHANAQIGSKIAVICDEHATERKMSRTIRSEPCPQTERQVPMSDSFETVDRKLRKRHNSARAVSHALKCQI